MKSNPICYPDCKLGVCMTCPAKMISGTVDQSGAMLSEDVAKKGYALLCVAQPTSDCKIVTITEVGGQGGLCTVVGIYFRVVPDSRLAEAQQAQQIQQRHNCTRLQEQMMKLGLRAGSVIFLDVMPTLLHVHVKGHCLA